MSEKNYVITITRQFGSMGGAIAKQMGKLLGIEYYDRYLVEETAKKLNMPVSEVEENEETAYLSLMSKALEYPLRRGTNMTQDEIFGTQQEIIKNLAKEQSCIIVGRCGDFALRNLPNAVHIYIYAPFDKRIYNCVCDLGIKKEEVKNTIVTVDESRDSYHLHYAGFYPEDRATKDIMIDSSVLGIKETADYLAEFVKRRFKLGENKTV